DQAVTPTPTATPTATPTPAPTPRHSEATRQLHQALETKLVALAQVAFSQGRSQLLSNNGAGLISDRGGSIIGNNGVGLISNNGGGLLSNNGAGYRVLQAAETINPDPESGEMLFIHSIWPDGTVTKSYVKDPAQSVTDYRTIHFTAQGAAVFSRESRTLERHGGGEPQIVETRETSLHEGGPLEGQLRHFLHYTTELLADGTTVRTANEPGASKFRDVGTAMDVGALAIEVASQSGTFRYDFPLFGLVETGTLANVALNAQGKFIIDAEDPLGYYDGESQLKKTDGTLLFTKRQETVSGTRQRSYDFGGGLAMSLKKAAARRYEGTLSQDGAEAAKVVMETRASGTVVFTLTYPEAEDTPIVLGYGLLDAAAEAPAAAANPPTHWVRTLAGAGTPGAANGTGAQARFVSLYGIAASRVTPNRFYMADFGGHTIRVLDLHRDLTCSVATYAGTGAPGFGNASRLQATFRNPFGLAVGPDDTIYVADAGNHAIRRIAPDGAVSTVVGTGTAGVDEGQGAAAGLYSPTGVAILPDGNLLVSEFGAHRLRHVDLTDQQTSTYAGTGAADFRDGDRLTARFNRPIALATDAAGHVYVADRDNYRVRKIDAEGTVSTYAGSGEVLKSFIDGPALQGGLSSPLALAFAPDGELFVAASTEIRRVSPTGPALRTHVAGWETGSFKNGSNKEALFGHIFGLAAGENGLLLATDGTRVRVVVPPGYFD
ncbi:MAG: hypothetical protein ACLGIN_15195, partial [Candidatus Sericytochromatia bacterium]